MAIFCIGRAADEVIAAALRLVRLAGIIATVIDMTIAPRFINLINVRFFCGMLSFRTFIEFGQALAGVGGFPFFDTRLSG